MAPVRKLRLLLTGLGTVLSVPQPRARVTDNVPIAVQLQRTSHPAELLRIASQGSASLAARPLAEALMRAASALKQPAHVAERAAVAASPAALSVLRAASAADPSPAMAVDLVRALALLDVSITSSSTSLAHRTGTSVHAGHAGASGAAPALVREVEGLLARACDGAATLSAGQVSALDWAAQRIGARLSGAEAVQDALDQMPFRAHAAVFGPIAAPDLTFEKVAAELRPHLRRDVICLDDSQGTRRVRESRLTGWHSRCGAAFCYSGKRMPSAVPGGVCLERVRARLEELSGIDYDGCLVNLYEHGKVGMRYHQDPDQGVLWSTDTHVVSFGCTRTFVLRRITDYADRHEFAVRHGDVVHMRGACQAEYQHGVRVESAEVDAGPRISLVFKKSLEYQ